MSKSKRGRSATTNELCKWETELNLAPFNEESWRSCLFFIAPNKFDDNVYLDILSGVIFTGLRKLFSVITEESLVRDVRELGKGQTAGGRGKGASSSRAPPFFEVCEQAKVFLDQGEVIPAPLMAKVIKFKLLQVKQKDLDRREEERKAAKAAEAAKKDDKGKKSRTPSAKRAKSPTKKKGKKDADVPQSPKKDSKLKRRGDVEDTFKTIDDEPDDEGCPKHYILIHGVWTAPVIQCLAEIGINVDSVICMESESYEKFETHKELGEEEAAEEKDSEILEKLAIQEEQENASKLEKEKELKSFWADSENIVLKAQSGHKLKDMAKYTVTVKDKDVPEESLKELDEEKRVNFGTILFEDVAVTCYDMLDHFVLYKKYLESMKLQHIPVHTTAVAPLPVGLTPSVTDVPSSQSVTIVPDPQGPISVEVDTRYYKHLMDTVPTDSHSVPIILHCLMEQVTATVDENNPLDRETPPRDDGLNHLLASHINSQASKLALTDDEKKSLTENVQEEKKPIDTKVPIMLHHGDALTSRTYHLQSQNGLDPMQAELKMLQCFPQNTLRELPEPKGRETVERAARANELRHFLSSKSVDPAILDQALKQYAFEGILLKTVNDDDDIIDPVDLDDAFKSYSNPWDYPYSRLEDFMEVKFCSDESGKLKISEIESNSPLTSFRNLDDWCFLEHFDQATLLQVLEEARFSLPYVDTYYHKRDHSLLLALHNPIGQGSRSQSAWQTKLHSNVGFRNYLEHVAPSIRSWVDEQERINREANRTPTPPPIVIEATPVPIKEGSRYGMLTRSDINAMKAEEDDKNKKGKGRKSDRGSKSPGRGRSPRSRAKDESPEKKDKKREGSSTSRPKSGRTSSAKGSLSVKSTASKPDKKGGRARSRISCQDDVEEDISTQPMETQVEEHYDFIGYDVGDNLMHASGSLSTLFPSDGGQIRVDRSAYTQGAQRVSVSVYKDGNMFVLHFVEPLGEIIEEAQTKQPNEHHVNQQNHEKNDEEGIEKSETEGSEKATPKEPLKEPKPFCDFSSFVAQFSDGMILTHSGYGPSGSLIDEELKKSDSLLMTSIAVPEAAGATHGTPSPQPKAGSPKSRKKVDEEIKRMEELQQQQDEVRQRLEEEAKTRANFEKQRKPFQNVYVTCPDGLHLEYLNDGSYASASDKGGVAVRQRYPVKGQGGQQCEETRQTPAMDEVSRTVLTNGTVIKFMNDGGVQVLFADGATSRCASYRQPSQPTPSKPSSPAAPKPTETSPVKKGLRASAPQKSTDEPAVPSVSLPAQLNPHWVSTGIGGARVGTRDDGEVESLDGVLYSLATCPETGQVVRTREDNVVTVEHPDGMSTVEHADGTCITTFYHQTEHQTQAPDNETGDQAQYYTVNEKFVKVECRGFATLLFNCAEGSCGTLCGNGVFMETLPDGDTKVDRVDGSRLHIDDKGVVSFAPREIAKLVDLSSPASAVETPEMQAGVYVMRSTHQVCCEMKDERGTRFKVVSNGEMSVVRSTNKGQAKTDQDGSNTSVPMTTLVPRYFILHSDGSGFELLRQADVSEYLSQAEKDPAAAVMRSPVEGNSRATGVTILRPYNGGISKTWLMQKDEDGLIPKALRERDFTSFPAREQKRAGAKFGTKVGSGLNVGNLLTNPPTGTVSITCSQALEFRQLIQYKKLTDEQRQQIVNLLKEYGEHVAKRQDKLDAILPQDPREESEKLRAANLEWKMTENKEHEDSKSGECHSQSEVKGVQAMDDVTKMKDGIREAATSMSSQLQGEAISQQYVDAITPAPVPTPSPPRWKRSQSEWERDKIELAELDYGKHALRNKQVPSYFDTAQGQEFLRHVYNDHFPEMDVLTRRLAEQTRHPPPGECSAPDTPTYESEERKHKSCQDYSSPEISQNPNSSANNDDLSSPSAVDNTLSPNNLRPTNPTPAHATGGGTPTPLRPNNPTPAHGLHKPVNSRPNNPTPKHAAEGQGDGLVTSDESPAFEESPQWRNNLESVQEVTTQHEQPDGIATQENSSMDNSDILIDTPGIAQIGPKSLYIDVTGSTRKDQVKLPNSILSSKPGALPNTQFIETEDPVRRRVNTVSVAGGNKTFPGRMQSLRGFELLPPKVSFGMLREGCTYIHSVLIKNVGIDSCRFKVKQPPLSTGMRVLYNPGPVAAGMSAKLDMEIFAVAVGVAGDSGVGQVAHHVEIVTETDVIYLPVYATILTSYEFENRYGDQDSGLTKGTSRVPNRPPSRDPTRPRKPVDYALINQETL